MPVYEALEVRAPLTLEEYKAQLVPIPAGSFVMGGERYDHEKPLHRVTLSAFQMGRTPVTVGMWHEFCMTQKGGKMPWLPNFRVWKQGWDVIRDHPIVNLSWEDCTEYANWAGLLLPTEAQWEYASRGGLESKLYPWGNEAPKDQLWWKSTRNKKGTAPVQRSEYVFVNGYGLVDMSGNVDEWCSDWYGEYPKSDNHDPIGASSGQYRVLRGGSWGHNYADWFRCAYRSWAAPRHQLYYHGFRLSSQGPCSAH